MHGGPTKAVYVYPSEHYEFWQMELPGAPLPWGMFGENLSTQGLTEDDVGIGDEFRIGNVRVRATEPRMPCYKLGIRFGRTDIVKRFLLSGRMGFYLAVAEEGHLQEGDSIERLKESDEGVAIADIARLYTTDRENVGLLRRVVAHDGLGDSWRRYFQRQLEKVTSWLTRGVAIMSVPLDFMRTMFVNGVGLAVWISLLLLANMGGSPHRDLYHRGPVGTGVDDVGGTHEGVRAAPRNWPRFLAAASALALDPPRRVSSSGAVRNVDSRGHRAKRGVAHHRRERRLEIPLGRANTSFDRRLRERR